MGAELDILRRTPWSRIKGQNSVYKEFLEVVGNETNGQCVKGDNCSFRHDMNKRGKVHHQIRLRILSCSKMNENHRGPEVPEVKAPVVECHDGRARITSEELAITHSVKNGTLQNACSTRLRVVVSLGKSARSHIEQPTKRFKTNNDKSAVAMLKKGNWQSPMNVTMDQGNLGREVIRNWDKIYLNVNFLMHGNWVAYFRA